VLFATAVIAVVATMGQAVAMLVNRPEMETDLEARRSARAGGNRACGDGQ